MRNTALGAEDHMTDNVQIVKNLYQAFGSGDVGAVLGAMDEKIEWMEAEGFLYADGNPYIGPAAVASGVFQRIIMDAENFAVSPSTFIGDGDSVVALGRYTGRMRATGIAVDAQFAHVWRLRDGKITGFQQYTDTYQWRVAAGAVAHGV